MFSRKLLLGWRTAGRIRRAIDARRYKERRRAGTS